MPTFSGPHSPISFSSWIVLTEKTTHPSTKWVQQNTILRPIFTSGSWTSLLIEKHCIVSILRRTFSSNFLYSRVPKAKSKPRAPNDHSGYTPELLIRTSQHGANQRDLKKTKFTLLKELQNCILYIIFIWSFFYSGPVYKACIFIVLYSFFVLYAYSMFWTWFHFKRLKNIWLIIQVFFFLFSHFLRTICKNLRSSLIIKTCLQGGFEFFKS